MNLFSRHLTGLFDFTGRENRQPFWLWVLITYAAQYVVGTLISIPLMMVSFQNMQPIFGRDPKYFDQHPEMMMQAMGPVFRWGMIVNAVLMLAMFALLAAAVVRRLHDSDRSGWWASPVFAIQIVTPILFATIFPAIFETFAKVRPNMSQAETNAAFAPTMQSFTLLWSIGMLGFLLTIVLIVFLVLPGTVGPNRFGDDPLNPPFR
jgi:uncharacterized membrane protein YhaH (DUF805 family)